MGYRLEKSVTISLERFLHIDARYGNLRHHCAQYIVMGLGIVGLRCISHSSPCRIEDSVKLTLKGKKD